jgi:hypothetical protein
VSNEVCEKKMKKTKRGREERREDIGGNRGRERMKQAPT